MSSIHEKKKQAGVRIMILPALLCMFILTFQVHAIAQERMIIYGIVFESETEIPLAGAHIQINGTSYGTISGPEGSYRLSVSELPVQLKITHVGFEDRYFIVEEGMIDETLMMGMNLSVEMLEGVTITDKKAEIIFKDASYSVLDFEFHENGLMLLIFRNRLKRSELVLLSYLNDTLALLTKLPGKAESLHRDCRDFIHYVAADTAYQVQYNGKDLILIHPTHVNIFKPVADAFVAYHENYYYFRIKKMFDQVIEYIRFDSISEQYIPFREVYDRKKLQVLRDNPEHFGLLKGIKNIDREFRFMLLTMSESAKLQMDELKMERDATIEGHYLSTTVYTPLYAPLFKSNDNILIFNHPESRIEFLSLEGKHLKYTSIRYNEDKDWNSLILKDDIHENYYAAYLIDNRISLRAIDIQTGETGSSNILYYPFVKKILVRNGYAYFTYRQPGSKDRTMLFRQKLQMEDNKLAISEN